MLLSTLSAILILLCELSLAKSPTRRSHRTKKRRACVQKPQSFLAEPKDGIQPIAENQPIANWTKPVGVSNGQSSSLPLASTPPTPGGPLGPGCIPDGTTVKASFTIYGTGDAFGSSSCTANMGACGFKAPGFTVAISQNAWVGSGPGSGPGAMCGATWKLTAGGASQTVTVDNLCPPEGNPLCSMPTLNDHNDEGGNVHFDLCIDSGLGQALLGSAGLGSGTATKLSGCGQGSGTVETY